MTPPPAALQRASNEGVVEPPPPVWRRLACFVYEGVLLFGVLMISAYLYSSLTQQRHALQGRHGLMAFLFLILAVYFTWFWSNSGQTVAMKAWHIRLVDVRGRPVTQARALMRYLASWMWLMPALFAAGVSGLHDARAFGLLFAGVLAYAALARLRPDRQFWHDALCGTRLITWRPVAKTTGQVDMSRP
jgi:uncharacterized RDD family membrane protein YckC